VRNPARVLVAVRETVEIVGIAGRNATLRQMCLEGVKVADGHTGDEWVPACEHVKNSAF
jgi:hypothetical protein